MYDIIMTVLIVFPIVGLGGYIANKVYNSSQAVLDYRARLRKYEDERADNKAKQLESNYDD